MDLPRTVRFDTRRGQNVSEKPASSKCSSACRSLPAHTSATYQVCESGGIRDLIRAPFRFFKFTIEIYAKAVKVPYI